MIEAIDKKIDEICEQLEKMKSDDSASKIMSYQLIRDKRELLEACVNLDAADKIFLARHPKRPKVDEYINAVFTDFFEQKGDCLGTEDASILGGIALFCNRPVTVLGHRKGNSLNDNIKYNFGMPGPEGYRKSMRIMKQAEKFGRPIITFIDTPGAYPGIEAEMYGQSQAIAYNLAFMSSLKVPVISIVTGEGSSGGALGIGVANRTYMLEHAIYSILSPEGFASILWGDASRKDEAAGAMKLTAQDLMRFEIIDGIIKEPAGGAHRDSQYVFNQISKIIASDLNDYVKKTGVDIARERYYKYRKIDEKYILSNAD